MTTALAALAVAAGSAAQAVTGFGSSLVAAPFLVALLGHTEGVRTAILFSGIVNVLVLLPERRGVRWREGAILLVPALAATPPLAWAVRRADPAPLAILAGALTLAGAAALAAGLRAARLRGPGGALAAGAVSAGMNVVAGIGGPAAALYAINAGWPPHGVRPTLQVYFLALNALGLSFLGLPRLRWWIGPAILGGWLGGHLLARRVSPEVVRRAALALAAAGGAVAIARGLAAL